MQSQSTKNRKGDTSRTSSQGRKQSSGGRLTKKKGSPDINEDTKNQVKEEKSKKLKVPARAIMK